MPNRNSEDYGRNSDQLRFDEHTTDNRTGDGPAAHYDPERFTDVREATQLLNEVALLDEETACIQYPAGNPEQHQKIRGLLQSQADSAVDHGMRVISFDIDLTLQTQEDQEETATLIDPGEISRLQGLGYVVGTCSDRLPSDQRRTMTALGQEPHFCIPKEMLGWAKELIPGETHLHVGDDARRDREIALESGWEHRWPDEYICPAT